MVDKQFGKIVRGCCLFLSISMLACVLWLSAQIWLGQTSLNQVPISHYCFRLYLVRFHLILQFWFSFVNSVNVTPLDPANIFSGSLLVCSRLHSWHKIKMFLAYNHCRGSASDQGKQNSAQYEGRFFGGPKKLVLPMWFPTLLNMSLFSKCPLQI